MPREINFNDGIVSNPTPFFTIGVMTYNRQNLLRQALATLLGQTFTDFEVIVGNDFTEEVLSANLFDIKDPRFRFVNYPKNLQEVGNMNTLLEMAHGKYFTWLADDDLFNHNFLEVLHEFLARFDFPLVAFPTFGFVNTVTDLAAKPERMIGRLFTGRQFLYSYLNGKLKVIGIYGVFETETLRSLGGFERLCDGPIGLFSEYMLLVRGGLLERIGYVDFPLVYYRAHENSDSVKMASLAMDYKKAGENLIRESAQVLSKPELANDFIENLLSLLNLVITVYAAKLSQDANLIMVRNYLFSLQNQFAPLKGTIYYWKAMICLVLTGIDWVDDKRIFNLPGVVVRLAKWVRSFFPKPRKFWG